MTQTSAPARRPSLPPAAYGTPEFDAWLHYQLTVLGMTPWSLAGALDVPVSSLYDRAVGLGLDGDVAPCREMTRAELDAECELRLRPALASVGQAVVGLMSRDRGPATYGELTAAVRRLRRVGDPRRHDWRARHSELLEVASSALRLAARERELYAPADGDVIEQRAVLAATLPCVRDMDADRARIVRALRDRGRSYGDVAGVAHRYWSGRWSPADSPIVGAALCGRAAAVLDAAPED